MTASAHPPVPAARPAVARASRARAALGGLAVPPKAAWCVAIAVFLSISRLHQHIQIMGRLRFPMIFSALAIIFIWSSTHKWRPKDLKKYWMPKTVGWIALIAIAGVPFSIAAGRSFWFLEESFLRTLLVAMMVWAVARTPRGQVFVGKLYFLSTFAAVVLALKVGRVDSEGRLSGGYTYDPNDLAVVALMCLPFSAWMMLQKGIWKVLGLVSIPMVLYVVMKSGSRGGFLALCACVLGFAWLMMAPKAGKLRKFGVGAMVLVALAVPFMPASYLERIATLFDNQDYNLTSATGRKEVWKRGIGYAVTHPVTGVGIANFDIAEGTLSDVSKQRQEMGVGFKWGAAHNMYIEVAAEMGLIAVALFIMLMVRSVWDLLFKRPPPTADEQTTQLMRFTGIAVLALATGGFFLSLAYYDIVYVALALGAGIRMPLANGAPPAPANGRSGQPLRGGPRRGMLPNGRRVPGR